MLRLILVLLGGLMPAGLGMIFVWSTLNAILHGDASLGRIVLGVIVLVAVVLLLFFTFRTASRMDLPQ